MPRKPLRVPGDWLPKTHGSGTSSKDGPETKDGHSKREVARKIQIGPSDGPSSVPYFVSDADQDVSSEEESFEITRTNLLGSTAKQLVTRELDNGFGGGEGGGGTKMTGKKKATRKQDEAVKGREEMEGEAWEDGGESIGSESADDPQTIDSAASRIFEANDPNTIDSTASRIFEARKKEELCVIQFPPDFATLKVKNPKPKPDITDPSLSRSEEWEEYIPLSKFQGHIGKLRFYKSGKVVLRLNSGLEYDILTGSDTSFLQQVVSVNVGQDEKGGGGGEGMAAGPPRQGTANVLGTIGSKRRFVASQSISSLLPK